MPYEGEFASYRALQRLVETDRVKRLISRAKVYLPEQSSADATVSPRQLPEDGSPLPDFIVAIDGSNQEVPVRNGYPGASLGYLTVASVLLDLSQIDRLDESRPVDPQALRQAEEAATIDSALPGSNVITRTHSSARSAFREELYDVFHDGVIDSEDRTALLETYERLLALKPQTRPQECPYADDLDLGCEEHLVVGSGLSTCVCAKRQPIWSTDALRIHEGFRDLGTNGEAFGEVMQVWERVLLVHLLQALERRGLLDRAHRLAFILDGPLAVFGRPAWLSAAISQELKRLNAIAKRLSGRDLLIIGVEKTGTFVTHFEEVDQAEFGGERFPPGSYFLPTDMYIKKRIIYSDSPKRYGLDTYFGRKFFYKTASGGRIVASVPFLSDEQDTLDTDDVSLYPSFVTVCQLLDKVASCRFPNAISPLVTAHAHAAIPLHLGAKVLEQLARALLRDE